MTSAVRMSVLRSCDKLLLLAACNPEAALLIERCIDAWMLPAATADDDGGEELVVPTRADARTALLA